MLHEEVCKCYRKCVGTATPFLSCALSLTRYHTHTQHTHTHTRTHSHTHHLTLPPHTVDEVKVQITLGAAQAAAAGGFLDTAARLIRSVDAWVARGGEGPQRVQAMVTAMEVYMAQVGQVFKSIF